MKNRILLLLTIVLYACSSNDSIDYYNSAQEKIKEKNFTEAVNDFEKFVSENPGNELAPNALFEIAKIYHSESIEGLSKEESLSKAVIYYKRVYEEYKNSSLAEQALFVAAFIQANEISQFDNAKENYELFLKQFPQSELTESVKIELDNLGLTPDEIIERALSNKWV